MKVQITVVRKTTYSSVIEMTSENFTRINAGLHSGERNIRREFEKECNHLIDTRDWQDDDFDSVEEFEILTEDSTL